MPQDFPTTNAFEALYQEIEALKKRINVYDTAAYPTIPVYDWDDPPQDAIEGQVALFVNAPDGVLTDGGDLDPGEDGFWKTVSGVLTRVTTVAWSELTSIPSTFAPSDHKNNHKTGGSDAFTVSDLLDAIARVGVRKNSTGSTFNRRRVNLIEGTNVTLTVADDSGSEEVDVTIAATGGSGDVATDVIWDAKGDLAVGTGANTAAKLVVGTNGQVPLADSTQTTGLIWGDIDGGSP